jgi:hypothetical protein
MKKFLLILLLLPLIGLGQDPCSVGAIAKLTSYNYEEDMGGYYSLDFNYQNGSSKNYIVDLSSYKNFDVHPRELKEGVYYFLNLSLSHSEYTASIYEEIINNIRHVTPDDKNELDFEPFD